MYPAPLTVPSTPQYCWNQRTLTFCSSPGKIHHLDNSNLLSEACHSLPWLVYSMITNREYWKLLFLKKTFEAFLLFFIYHPSLTSKKIIIYGILKRIFGQWLNCEAKIFIFQYPKFEFPRGSILFQGIVPGGLLLSRGASRFVICSFILHTSLMLVASTAEVMPWGHFMASEAKIGF